MTRYRRNHEIMNEVFACAAFGESACSPVTSGGDKGREGGFSWYLRSTQASKRRKNQNRAHTLSSTRRS